MRADAPADMNSRTEELLARAAWMRRLARTLARDDAEADDLVQEAWVATLSGNAVSLEGRPGAGMEPSVLRA